MPAIDPGLTSPLADPPERITHPGLLHAPRLTSHLVHCALWQGDWNLTAALLSLGVSEDKCEDAQKTYCDSMIDFNVQGGQSKNEARIATMKSYDQCRACLMTPADKKDFPPPFSLKSGKYHGNQFVSLGGGANAPPWTVEMASIGNEEIEKVKLAGFTGICFDIEAVDGRDELIAAFEETFARCRNAGVQVFITTSHSAPYESVPDKTRFDIVDAWAKSDNIDYFSPQLYTQGSESTPDFTEATGAGGVSVEWGRFKNMKAKFVPSSPTKPPPPHEKAASLKQPRDSLYLIAWSTSFTVVGAACGIAGGIALFLDTAETLVALLGWLASCTLIVAVLEPSWILTWAIILTRQANDERRRRSLSTLAETAGTRTRT